MVLCLSHSGDYYTIDIVQQYLALCGIRSFRLNLDEWGLRYRLRYDLQQLTITDGRQTICAADIKAVWYRKWWNIKPPGELEPAWKEIFVNEYNVFRQIFLNALGNVPWMNKLHSDTVVNNDKLWQLQAARATGLSVPQSVFTNDAAVIREFFSNCGHSVIMKLHGALSKSMSGNSLFFPTTLLNESDLPFLDQLVYCPMIFQEYIPKAYELRIAYVDGEFFTGKIPCDDEQKIDWRTTTGGPIAWERYELPRSVCEMINNMMQELDLVFGAIDMIRHINGEYVFLEVNPQGEWGMLQKYLNYPIGETIAGKLITAIQPCRQKKY